MKQKNLDILINYVFQIMADASDEENRLTIYFLTIFLFTSQEHCWIYHDELVNGRDKFLGSCKREQLLRGTGLTNSQTKEAIRLINKRGLLTVEPQSHSEYFYKVILNTSLFIRFNYEKYI